MPNRRLDVWQRCLREQAEHHRVAAGVPDDSLRLVNSVLALLYRSAAGTVAGLGVGYVSHVVLDAFMPVGLSALA